MCYQLGALTDRVTPIPLSVIFLGFVDNHRYAWSGRLVKYKVVKYRDKLNLEKYNQNILKQGFLYIF